MNPTGLSKPNTKELTMNLYGEISVDLHGRSNTRDFEIFELITFSGSI